MTVAALLSADLAFGDIGRVSTDYKTEEELTYLGCRWRTKMSLYEILEFTLCNSVELESSRLDTELAHNEGKIIEATYMPIITGKSTASLSAPNGIHSSSFFGVEAGLEIWDGGRTKSKIRRNQFYSNAAKYKQDIAKYYVMTRSIETYYDIWAAKQRFLIFSMLHEASVRSLLVSQGLFTEGLLSKLDLLRIQAIERKYTSQLYTSRMTVKNIERSFKMFLGLASYSRMDIASKWGELPDVDADSKKIQSFFKDYYFLNPKVREQEQMLGVYMAEADMIASSKKPVVTVQGRVNSNGIEKGYSWGANLTITIPISESGRQYKTVISDLNIMRASSSLSSIKLHSDIEISKHRENFSSLRDGFFVTKAYVDLASKRFSLMLEKYKLRVASVTELTDAYEDFLHASEAMINAARNHGVDKLTNPCYFGGASSNYAC